MRRMTKIAWVVLAAASVIAAGAQQRGGHFARNGAGGSFHSGFSAGPMRAPGSFVSLPGHAVFTPGQAVFTPGRSVFTPGQSVFTPGQSVFTPGREVFAAPHVLTPFSGPAGRMQWRGGYGRQDRYHYRHRYGGEYGVPYLFGTGYWVSPYDLGYSDFIDEDSESTASAQPAAEAGSESAVSQPPYAQPYEDDYRPEYHAPANAPNVVQSEEPTLTVVMKDGTQKQMRNYALTPTTLIDLDAAASGREMNIPLDEVNLTATEKVAAQAGLSFNVPKG